MNVKRVFGSVLTILGIIGVIYAAFVFVNMPGDSQDIRFLIYGVIGIVFLFSGISLIRTVKDEA